MKEAIKQFLLNICMEHPGKAAGASIGILLGIAILLFGFWKTAFVVFCGLAGLLIGKSFDEGAEAENEPFWSSFQDMFLDRLNHWRQGR
jgi:uncharacterized membrane protein